ncbi:hypothetical protein E6P09_04490 [Haloferax mediterranei ATCC 33500]|uniref:Uncharacterized protein n=1 Tax=Haloferax mediterranei (strain ATCC 33500 / DSM 1411 / JCM 8866 / NBRC 14739 / NCIMB 2177 / R-4) TaxID=523841 RepID=I3R1A9_HALMT|nr:hypothetical protein [Haloferax mediterranei]AFK18019.1 hypothetical protein HFX_0280 [Haloferax mediterranei ATCC 33500]AHZ22566.1 hypothetical protein BM92_07850 [Haloferax mediterranei ATCC 33500]EMA02705.1 hypothetical protein C439_08980 [Haloferax mediterranei ATCC 33500]MDX5988111.1 hypothetical protein [Haloferax mediterranei ATCC 33500]QCQ74562.1 hypothetical protein E6P09_04490 [Haloferax mediterranei ATCC 33500]
MDDRLESIIRSAARTAGKRYEEVKRAYQDGQQTSEVLDSLPQDAEGGAKIVCRRHVERRAVAIDAKGRPACFDPDHPDCRGCVEDIREGIVETW